MQRSLLGLLSGPSVLQRLRKGHRNCEHLFWGTRANDKRQTTANLKRQTTANDKRQITTTDRQCP